MQVVQLLPRSKWVSERKEEMREIESMRDDSIKSGVSRTTTVWIRRRNSVDLKAQSRVVSVE